MGHWQMCLNNHSPLRSDGNHTQAGLISQTAIEMGIRNLLSGVIEKETLSGEYVALWFTHKGYEQASQHVVGSVDH